MKMIISSLKSKVKTKKDWTRAKIIAALHDKQISLKALAQVHGLADATSLSHGLSHSSPLAERRIADALGVQPLDLWPSRFNADGTRIKRFQNTYILSNGVRK
jgi:Ner family transcriptional regulator